MTHPIVSCLVLTYFVSSAAFSPDLREGSCCAPFLGCRPLVAGRRVSGFLVRGFGWGLGACPWAFLGSRHSLAVTASCFLSKRAARRVTARKVATPEV